MGDGFGLGGGGPGRPGLLPVPLSTHIPGSGLPASLSSSTSHQREEERERETLEPTQSKTRESYMRVGGGNADVLQDYSRLSKRQGETLGGMGQRRFCGPQDTPGLCKLAMVSGPGNMTSSPNLPLPTTALSSSLQPVSSRTNSCFPGKLRPWQCSHSVVPNRPVPLTAHPINPEEK